MLTNGAWPPSSSFDIGGTSRKRSFLLELKRDGPAARADRGAQDDLGEHPAQEPAGVRLNEHMEHPEAAVVFQHACKMGLEGLVSKRLGSRYRSGRCPDWLKFKESGSTGG